MQVQPEVVRHEAVITQPIHSQAAFQLLIAILALTPQDILVIRRFRIPRRSRAIRHHEAAVRPLRVRLRLHHHKAGGRPGTGPIPEPREQPLRLVRLVPEPDRFCQQFLAGPLEDGVGR